MAPFQLLPINTNSSALPQVKLEGSQLLSAPHWQQREGVGVDLPLQVGCSPNPADAPLNTQIVAVFTCWGLH